MATIVTKTVKPGGGGNYSTLAAFVAGEQRNLSSLNQIARAEVYAGVDTAPCTVAGFGTSSFNYVLVEPAPGAHHLGRVDAPNAYRMEPSTQLVAYNDFRIHGVQVTTWGARALAIQAQTYSVTECILRTPYEPSIPIPLWISSSSPQSDLSYQPRLIANNLILGAFFCGIQVSDNYSETSGVTASVMNNTVVATGSNAYYPLWMASDGGVGGFIINNAFCGNYTFGGEPRYDYSTNFYASAINNAVFANSQAATHFFNPAALDYRPMPGGSLHNMGVAADAYDAPATSINGVARPFGPQWDIGAFEYAPPTYASRFAAQAGRAVGRLTAGYLTPVYASALAARSGAATAALAAGFRPAGSTLRALSGPATARLTAGFTVPVWAVVVQAASAPASASLRAAYTPVYATRLAGQAKAARVRLAARYLKPPAWMQCGERPYADRRAVVRGAFRVGRPRD